jgi:hypothetical protein
MRDWIKQVGAKVTVLIGKKTGDHSNAGIGLPPVSQLSCSTGDTPNMAVIPNETVSWFYVGEIDNRVVVYFALDDSEDLSDVEEELDQLKAEMRRTTDGDGRPLWDGLKPIIWRNGTRNEMASFGETPQTINHLLCGWGFPTVPDGLAIQ